MAAGESGTPAETTGTGTGGVNAWAAGISGDVTISGWLSTGAEGDALTNALCAAQKALPNLKITYQPVAGDYAAFRTADFGNRAPPDLFYVDANFAQPWINETFLQPLDDYIAQSQFDTSQFFEGYANIFKGPDGKTYGFPKDGNTIGMAYNSDMVQTPPATLDELKTWATANKGTAGAKAPICFASSLDRAMTFIYAQGGGILTADNTGSMVEDPATKAGIQWYLDMYKDNLAMTPSAMGDGWCGEAIGKGDVAIAFEGGWLDPYMTGSFPAIHYKWAPVPTGTSGSPVTISFTAAYAIGADSANKDQAFALLTYLAGPEGMRVWTEGGVALPSRKDVPIPAGKETLAGESVYARPGSGLIVHWQDVNDAFNAAMTNELQNKTYSADTVVSKTKAAIDTALAPQ